MGWVAVDAYQEVGDDQRRKDCQLATRPPARSGRATKRKRKNPGLPHQTMSGVAAYIGLG